MGLTRYLSRFLHLDILSNKAARTRSRTRSPADKFLQFLFDSHSNSRSKYLDLSLTNTTETDLDVDLTRSRSSSSRSKRFVNKMTAEVNGVKEIKLSFQSKISSLTDQECTNEDNDSPSAPAFEDVVKLSSHSLLSGGVVAVPTDTIYGIAGLAQNNDAVDRIYDIKQRNYEKPLAISVGTIDDIYKWSKVTVPRQLLMDLLPGPVTVVLERSPELNPALNPQASLVGFRIPDHIFMKELAIKCNSPIALTSANISGDKSCLQVEEFQHLWPLFDLVVNGGKLNDSEEARLGSTVVDLSVQGTYRIIRPGSAHAQTCSILQDRYKLKEASQTFSSR